MLPIVLALSMTLTPPPPPAPSLGGSPRTATLMEETRTLERRVHSATRQLPVWVPLAAGIGGGAAVFGLGYWLLSELAVGSFSGLGSFAAALGAITFVAAGPVFVIAGIITAIVFAVKNTGRLARLRDLQDQLAEKRSELAQARQLDPAHQVNSPTTTVLTF